MKVNTIIQGDCLDVMKSMPDKSVNLIVTSPPYNKGKNHKNIHKSDSWKGGGSFIDYISHDDSLTEEEYRGWQIEILNEAYRIMTDDGSFFYNHKNRTSGGKIISPFEWLIKSDLNIKQEIIWKANNLVEIDRVKFFPLTERIYWLVKGVPKFNGEFANFSDVWEIAPARGKARLGHPAPFPVDIPSRAIVSVTNENDIVLDPFMGSGTTAIACIKTNRNFIGIEKEPKYVEMAEQRIENELAQTRLFV